MVSIVIYVLLWFKLIHYCCFNFSTKALIDSLFGGLIKLGHLFSGPYFFYFSPNIFDQTGTDPADC